MNEAEYKKWKREVLKERKKMVTLAKRDVKFAVDQIAWWKKFHKQCEAALIERQNAVKEWESTP